MKTLILKLNATGDVVRTTPLLDVLAGPVTWVTADRNLSLIQGVHPALTCLSWDGRARALEDDYDLLINLEDDVDVAEFGAQVRRARTFGAHLSNEGKVTYTEDSRGWFDLSLVSRFGRARADQLKLLNRRAYQELIFEGLGYDFRGQTYRLPAPERTALMGDVALAVSAGPVWPMKAWAFYEQLQQVLQSRGLMVNVLPQRETLLQHLGDVANHRCIVCSDSLPMHLAIGLGKRAVAIFNCTSPWEIHGYGLLTKLVSPQLDRHFYKRTFDSAATTAISLDSVLDAVTHALNGAPAA